MPLTAIEHLTVAGVFVAALILGYSISGSILGPGVLAVLIGLLAGGVLAVLLRRRFGGPRV